MNKVFFGDCRDTMRDLIAQGVKVQMCVTSPPYFGLRDYGHPGQLGLEETPADYVAAMVQVFALVREMLADDGVLWLNLGDTYGDGKQLLGIPWRVALALQSDGWTLRQDIIWHKPNPMPESVKDRCTKAHEYIFLLSKNDRYLFDSEAIAEPSKYGPGCGWDSARQGTYSDEQRKSHDYREPQQSFRTIKETRNRRSVWEVPTMPYTGAHFATFPPALIEPCILAGSRPGDTVLDCFFGSGTTGEVAGNLGRNWIGCEINEGYAPLQRARTAQSGLAL